MAVRYQTSFEYLLLSGGVIILALVIIGTIAGIGGASEAFSKAYALFLKRVIP